MAEGKCCHLLVRCISCYWSANVCAHVVGLSLAMKTSIVISNCGHLSKWSNAKGLVFPVDDERKELTVDSSGGTSSWDAKRIYLTF